MKGTKKYALLHIFSDPSSGGERSPLAKREAHERQKVFVHTAKTRIRKRNEKLRKWKQTTLRLGTRAGKQSQKIVRCYISKIIVLNLGNKIMRCASFAGMKFGGNFGIIQLVEKIILGIIL